MQAQVQVLTLQFRIRSMPERRKWSVAYAEMDLSKALRMWSWLSIWRMEMSDRCTLGKYLIMSSKICTQKATFSRQHRAVTDSCSEMDTSMCRWKA